MFCIPVIDVLCQGCFAIYGAITILTGVNEMAAIVPMGSMLEMMRRRKIADERGRWTTFIKAQKGYSATLFAIKSRLFSAVKKPQSDHYSRPPIMLLEYNG